jgi:hypothetical protein
LSSSCPCLFPPCSPGMVHAWVGQKLLNCFIFKCFTRKTLKNKSSGHR